MPTVKSIGRKKKKRKLAPAAPAEEVTPKKDDAPEVDDEAPEEHMLDMIEGVADLALELVVEELIDVGKMVELQMRRLHKREVIAAGCREAFASRFGRFEAWEWNGKDERRVWWDAWESSCERSSRTFRRSGEFRRAMSACACQRCVGVWLCAVGAGMSTRGTRGRSIISVGVRCRLVRLTSVSKQKKWVLWTYRPRVFFVFCSDCCSFFSSPVRIRGAFSGVPVDPRLGIFRRIGSNCADCVDRAPIERRSGADRAPIGRRSSADRASIAPIAPYRCGFALYRCDFALYRCGFALYRCGFALYRCGLALLSLRSCALSL